MAKNIVVFIEQRDAIVQSVAYELIGEAKRLALGTDRKVIGLLIGSGLENASKELSGYGLDELVVYDDEALALYDTLKYNQIMSEYLEATKPDIVLIGATSIGRDLAPRCSATLKTGLTADCTKLEIDQETDNLLMTRPAFGGNIMATIICQNHRPQMATVRGGVMSAQAYDANSNCEIKKMSVNGNALSTDVKVLEVVKLVKDKSDIREAKILISGGRGIGSKDNFDLLKGLAKKIGGEIAGSRAAVDEGWVEKSRQVGQTGTTVRPELYIACGISGAIQHIAGMEQSGKIIAINKDPDAPIFGYADVGIVGDYKKIIPMIEKELAV